MRALPTALDAFRASIPGAQDGEVIACKIPVLRPKLPAARHLLPYLRKIDATRVYSNFGPLSRAFCDKLAMHLGVAPDAVLAVSSGTAGLIAAILTAQTYRSKSSARKYAALPSFTFVATAIAIERCGFRPMLFDVDDDTWSLRPEQLLGCDRLSEIGVVVVAAPFGRPVAMAPWREFQRQTSIPVVIDAAAGFMAMTMDDPAPYVGAIPTVLSFHATKSFGIGEGGCIVSTDVDYMRSMAQAVNFGFDNSRESRVKSLNGKMSEYHAAVGLAVFDSWDSKKKKLLRAADYYRAEFCKAGYGSFHGAPEIDGHYALYRAASRREAAGIVRSLSMEGIATRSWYGLGVHSHEHFRSAQHTELHVSERLGTTLIGLPAAEDLSKRDVAKISRIVTAVAANGMDAKRDERQGTPNDLVRRLQKKRSLSRELERIQKA